MVKYTPNQVPLRIYKSSEYRPLFQAARANGLTCWIVFVAGLFVKTRIAYKLPSALRRRYRFPFAESRTSAAFPSVTNAAIVIYLSYKVTSVPLVFRMVMVAIGALSGTGFYMLCRRLTNQRQPSGRRSFL